MITHKENMAVSVSAVLCILMGCFFELILGARS